MFNSNASTQFPNGQTYGQIKRAALLEEQQASVDNLIQTDAIAGALEKRAERNDVVDAGTATNLE